MNVHFAIGSYVLCRFGDPVANFKVKATKVVESQAYPRGNYIETFDRQNWSTSVSLQVIREWPNLSQMYDNMLLHAVQIPVLVSSIVITTQLRTGYKNYFFRQGKVIGLNAGHQGVTTKFDYTILGGLLTTTPEP